jgi:hypothetical protein
MNLPSRDHRDDEYPLQYTECEVERRYQLQRQLCAPGVSTALCALCCKSINRSMAGRQPPHELPAPQASRTSFRLRAPSLTHRRIVWSLTAWQWQTSMPLYSCQKLQIKFNKWPP